MSVSITDFQGVCKSLQLFSPTPKNNIFRVLFKIADATNLKVNDDFLQDQIVQVLTNS